MASIIPVGNKFRAQIRRAGQKTLTKTFSDKKDADLWAMTQERDIELGNRQQTKGRFGMTVSQAIARYKTERKPESRSVLHTLGTLDSELGQWRLEKLTDDIIVDYFTKRETSASTNQIHFSFLKAVLRRASIGWGYHVPDVLKPASARLVMLGNIAPSGCRNRRPTEKEIELLTKHDYKSDIPMADIINFAINTAMRQAEITRIEWSGYHPHEPTQLIEDRKHPKKKKGNHQTVPLLNSAIEIIERQQKSENETRIFPHRPETIGAMFSTACKKLGIVNLHFHDLRHEGTTRLFEMGYAIQEVQLFTGHLDWKMLNRYTHLKAKDVRRLEPEKKTEQAKIDLSSTGIDMDELRKELKAEIKREMMAQLMGQAESA